MLLDVLEIEFKESNSQEGHVVLEKFIGREKQNFEFVTECSVCQYKPNDKTEKLSCL